MALAKPRLSYRLRAGAREVSTELAWLRAIENAVDPERDHARLN